MGLDGVEGKARVLDILTSASSKGQVGVEGGVPASQESALDLGVLGETGLADTLRCKRILLQSSRQRILTGAGVVLVKQLAARQTGASDGMAEGLGLGLGSRGGDESGLCLGGGGGRGKKVDLFADGAAKVLESLLDVRRIIVGLVGILRAVSVVSDKREQGKPCQGKDVEVTNSRHSKHLLVSLLEGVDTLLEVNVVGGELGLYATCQVSHTTGAR